MLSLDTIAILISAVGAVIAAIVGLMNQNSISRSQQPLFELNRTINLPAGTSLQMIEVSHPDKTIEKCSVFYDGKPLVCLNNTDRKQHERTILAMGLATFLLPEKIIGSLDENAKIVVKDGKKKLKSIRLKDVHIA
jgi:hypothetical protein